MADLRGLNSESLAHSPFSLSVYWSCIKGLCLHLLDAVDCFSLANFDDQNQNSLICQQH